MRRLMRLMSVCALLLATVLMPSSAQADPGVAVVITIAQAFPGGPPAGWTASGAFTDSGSWMSDSVDGSFPSPTTAAFHRDTTETGSAGTFHMMINFTITVVGLTSATWAIPRTGTDGYASLTGEGTCVPTSGPTPFVITCTGVVHR